MSGKNVAPIVYEFIIDCLPKKDAEILKDAMANRAAWNYGTSDFIVSKIDKHYRKIADKILREIDAYTEKEGPFSFSEEVAE